MSDIALYGHGGYMIDDPAMAMFVWYTSAILMLVVLLAHEITLVIAKRRTRELARDWLLTPHETCIVFDYLTSSPQWWRCWAHQATVMRHVNTQLDNALAAQRTTAR